jgi:hypothetical protein
LAVRTKLSIRASASPLNSAATLLIRSWVVELV